MKKVSLLLISILCILLVISGCSKESTKKEESTTQSASDVVVVNGDKVSIDGADIKSLDVVFLGNSTFNISLIFENKTDKDAEFDSSNIEIRFGKEKATVLGSVTTIKANEDYMQVAQPFKNGGSLKVGDSVEVFYGSTKIADAKVQDHSQNFEQTTTQKSTDATTKKADSTKTSDKITADIVGVWKAKEGSNEYVFTFNSDGTGKYEAGGATMDLDYTVKGDEITVKFSGYDIEAIKSKYSINGDKLKFNDSEGNEKEMTRVK